jgi:acyl-CoA synthetase (AMP-forming)/AMP-acid ligase II
MSESFQRPAFDDSLLLPQWIEYNARHSPDHPLFAYASSHGDLTTITWSKAARAIETAARIVNTHLKARHRGDKAPPVVGILANLGILDFTSQHIIVRSPTPADSITYHTLYLGILRAGGTAFLISTRNSPVAVSHLLKQTGTHTLLVSADEPMQTLASSALVDAGEDHGVNLLAAPSFLDLYSEEIGDQNPEILPEYPVDFLDSPAMILHSSGMVFQIRSHVGNQSGSRFDFFPETKSNISPPYPTMGKMH